MPESDRCARFLNAPEVSTLRRVLRRCWRPLMLRSIFVVGSSSAFVVASSFLRGVILARILGPHQYGLALILITVTGALDLFADAGIDRFIVQNRFGYRADILRTSHAFRVGGSAFVGLAIVALAYPLSLAFHAPELAVPIAATGGVVGLRGFMNLSYKLQQRDRRFGSETIVYGAMFGSDLLVTGCLAFWTHSYWSVLGGAYVNAIAGLVVSHLLATKPYSFAPRARLVKLVSRFSVPIYLNAAILLAAAQGDRLVIAASFSKKDLAFYAAACAMGQGVIALSGRVVMNILLPVLSPRTGTIETRRRNANLVGATIIAGSVVMLAGLTTLGPWAVPLIYGPAFHGLGMLIFASGVIQMIQLEQSWLTTLLMANGLTRDFPRITTLRAIAFPAAFAFVALGFSILAIPLAFAVGATLSLVMSYYSARTLGVIDRRLVAVSFTRIAVCLLAVLWLARRH